MESKKEKFKCVHFLEKSYNLKQHFAEVFYKIGHLKQFEFLEELITRKLFKTRIDVYETLCPQQMLVHKGGKIKNWGGECRDVTPTKSLSQNIRVDVNREVKFL